MSSIKQTEPPQGLPMTRNCPQITGQKQQSGSWNLGAVANAFAAYLL